MKNEDIKKLDNEQLENSAGGRFHDENNDKICPRCKQVYFNTQIKNCEVCGTKLLELPCTIVED